METPPLALLAIFGRLVDLVGSGAKAYPIVFGSVTADAIFPILPSETVVIAAGVGAAHGKLWIWLVVLVAALGSFAGDNIAYVLGRLVGDPVADKLFGGEKGRRRLRDAERLLERHGVVIITAVRFIPGGRTATTFAAGTVELPWPRFAFADAIAAVLWATYAGMLGYFGGATFAHSTWKALALAGAIAAVVFAAGEVYRRVQKARGRDILGAKQRR